MAVENTTLTAAGEDGEITIPLSREEIGVSIREVVTGLVEVSTVTHFDHVLIDEALTRQHADIERVHIGRVVESTPDVREEDGVIIVPVMEEIVVVERRLFLKEEVRIRRATSTHRHQETVTVRQQEAVVQRTPAAESPSAAHSGGVPVPTEEIMP